MSNTATETASATAHAVTAFTVSAVRPEEQRQGDGDRSSTVEPLELIVQDVENVEADYPTGAKFCFICLSMALVLILDALDSNILATALPAITNDFHTVADIGWYSSAYRLAACSSQFLYGKLYKIFPVKTLFLVSTSIFLAGSIVCAAAPSSLVFIIGRAITGLASAGIVSGIFTILVHILPLRKRPLYTSMYGALESAVVIVAPLIGGFLTQSIGWRWCFWINLPIGGVAIVALMFFLSEPRARGQDNLTWKAKLRQMDLLGNLVFIPSLTCLLLALSWAGTKYSWSDGRIISLFVVFAVLLAAFCVDQYIKQDSATIPPRILKNRNVLAGFLFSACTNSVMTVLQYYLPTYFQAVKGVSPSESAVLMLPIVVGFLVAMLLLGGGISLTGHYVPFMLFASITMPIGAGLMTLLRVNTETARLIAYLGLAGFAGGIGFQAPQTAVQNTLPTADATMGLAIILFAQSFGPAVFVIVAQTIFVSRLSTNLGTDVTNIESMGIGDLRNSFGEEKVPMVLLGIDRSISQTWYLAVALASLTVIGSLGMEWRSVKQKRT